LNSFLPHHFPSGYPPPKADEGWVGASSALGGGAQPLVRPP